MGRYEFNQPKEEINIPEIIKEIKSIPLLVKWLQKVKMFHKIFINYQCLLDLL